MSTSISVMPRLDEKANEKRSQNQIEVMEQRLEKLCQDMSILQSRTGIKKQQVSQKNLDQLMSLLNKKIQQYSFPDTTIGQNHYKLVQKGMDAPSLERKLQEQRFLAEKELSNKSNQEKSLFWMDIIFSKEGIDNYLENNQNFVMFNAVDTMRSRNSVGETFANRLLAKKTQLKGVLNELYGSNVTALTNAPGFKYDQFNRLEQESSQNMEVYLRAMNQFQIGNYSKYCSYLAENSRDFKEVWQLLEKMVPNDGSNIFKTSKKFQRLRRGNQQSQNQMLQLQYNLNLQNAYHNGISYLQQIYRRNAKLKKQNFSRIYEMYNVEQVQGFQDSSIPIWQEIYQLFRAGDYSTIQERCCQYADVDGMKEFGEDLQRWLENQQRKSAIQAQKMRNNWDAFRYQIYLIMIKDPQCVEDVFVEDLDDCMWMNLKCCESFTSQYEQDINNPMIDDEEDLSQEDYEIMNAAGGNYNNASALIQNNNTSFNEDNENFFFESILKGQYNSEISASEEDGMKDQLYSWISWQQLQELRKMLYVSFKESPEVFNPSRVLMIQLLTLDFVGFVQTLRQLEKNAISHHELIHFLIVVSKSGLIRASIECAAINSDQNQFAAANEKEILIQKCKEIEDFAEKQIILYSKDRYESHPDIALSYIECLPIKVENQLQKFADIIVGSNQNIISLFKPNLEPSQYLANSSSSNSQRNRTFDQQIYKINNRLKNTPYYAKPQVRGGNKPQSSESILTQLAKIVATTYIKKQNNVAVSLQILDNVSAIEDLGQVLKEQYRLCASVLENQGLKNQLKNHTDTQKLFEVLEKYNEKYFGKKSKIAYQESKKQKIDGHIIQFYRLFRKVKIHSQTNDINITPILEEMQDLQYISSAQRETAASEFYDTLRKEEKSSYFEFLYLIFICSKKFFDSLKNPTLYNQTHKPLKPEEIEKAKKIFKTIIKYSNDFYSKHSKDIDKDFDKILSSARQQSQLATQI